MDWLIPTKQDAKPIIRFFFLCILISLFLPAMCTASYTTDTYAQRITPQRSLVLSTVTHCVPDHFFPQQISYEKTTYIFRNSVILYSIFYVLVNKDKLKEKLPFNDSSVLNYINLEPFTHSLWFAFNWIWLHQPVCSTAIYKQVT